MMFFFYDGGLIIYQWNGKNCAAKEKNRAANLVQFLISEREGKPKLTVFDEGDKDLGPFWKAIGGGGEIPDVKEVGDAKWEKDSTRKLLKVVEEKGNAKFNLEADNKLSKSLLKSNGLYIVDVGGHIYLWVGSQATKSQRSNALNIAHAYACQTQRSLLPCARVCEGREGHHFSVYFQ